MKSEEGVSYCLTLTQQLTRSNIIGNFLLWLQDRIKRWSRPVSLFSGFLSDLTRTYSDLSVENALLRQQLIILNRQVKKPAITNSDRFWLVLLSRFTKFWKQSIHIVEPDTLLRWHRELFRFYWRRKSQGRPQVSSETIAIIRKLAKENVLRGAEAFAVNCSSSELP